MSDLCVIVPACSVPKVREFFKEKGLADPTRRLKFDSEESSVAIPIDGTKILMKHLQCDLDNNEETNCKLICDYLESCLPGKVKNVKRMNLPPAKRLNIQTPEICLKNNLKRILNARGCSWTDELVQDIPTHWEKHGDLILLPASSFIHPVWRDFGKELWECVTSCLSCKRVARKDVVSKSGYRTPQVQMLHGESSWVQHADNGIKYTYDITKCMFSSGNITEKLRLAKFDCSGEVVVDLYAGIGYFTLPYLVYTKVKHLHACEWNPYAVEALLKNLLLNGVQDRCTVHKGDNRQMCLRGIADRVNLGLVPSSREGWPVACAALKPLTGGVLHIHHNVNTKPPTESCDQHLSSTPLRDLFLTEARVQSLRTNQSDKQYLPTEDFSSYYLNDLTEKGEIVENKMADNFHSKHQDNEENKSKTVTLSDCDQSCDFESPKPCTNGTNVDRKGYTVGSERRTAESKYKFESCHPEDQSPEMSEDMQNKCVDTPSTVFLQNRSNKNITTCDIVPAYSKWFPWAKKVSREIRGMLEALHGNEWKTTILHIEHVKSYAPHVDHIVLDLECQPLNKTVI